MWVWTRYNTEGGCDVRPAKSVVARDHHKTDVNGVYHRPSRHISQQHVGFPPRDPERAEMQASIFNSGGRCEGREEEERQCERETSRAFNITPYNQHTGSGRAHVETRDMRRGTLY